MTASRTLTAIDFSPASLAALEFAVVLASKEHEPIVHAVHAISLPRTPVLSGEAVLAADFDARLRAEHEEALRKAVERHAHGPVAVHPHVVEGAPASAIVAEAKARDCTRIAVGATGRGVLPRFLLGSTAERVVRTSGLDVLVVPAPGEHAPARTRIRNVVCALDFAPPSGLALQRASAISRAHDARLHVVHAWHVAPYVARMPELLESIERDMGRELDATAHRHETPGRTLLRHLRRGVPDVEILRAATEVEADLVVVGTTGKTGVDHFLLGSVAERVTRASHVPVLVARVPVSE